jgi:hypothetical protein
VIRAQDPGFAFAHGCYQRLCRTLSNDDHLRRKVVKVGSGLPFRSIAFRVI